MRPYDDYEQEPYGQEPPYGPADEPEEQDEGYEPYAPYDEGQPYQRYGDYGDPPPRRAPRPRPRPPVISTNPTINLICTLCALCGPLGLFFFFADEKSRAVRRFAVQSSGLFCTGAFLSMAMLVLGLAVGWMPIVGSFLVGLLWVLWAALAAFCLYLRVRLMLHAYRGEGYVLPIIGARCRQFE
ncbi:MAG: hypothetical protein LBU67_07620 [Oscillospiraceae bacterium]|jgi:uncharacterized membrane protein|nr:hypothetical protein [Oscillospiraceae bacterium]